MTRRLSSAHAIALLALVLALSGGAYAATKIGAKDIKRGAVRSRHIRNNTVAARDLTPGVRAALERRGPRGLSGPRGATGPRGVRGRRGFTGPTGPQGPAGTYPDALAKGRSLRGVFAVDSAQDDSVSFALTLPSAPAVHVVGVSDAAPAECPGNATTPTAAAGHLCLYVTEGAAPTVFDPGQPRAAGAGKAGRYGFGLTADAAGAGTWAVTAP